MGDHVAKQCEKDERDKARERLKIPCRQGDVEKVKEILKGYECDYKESAYKYLLKSSFVMACEFGSKDLVRALLSISEQNEDPEGADKQKTAIINELGICSLGFQKTGLMVAVENKEKDIVDLLLQSESLQVCKLYNDHKYSAFHFIFKPSTWDKKGDDERMETIFTSICKKINNANDIIQELKVVN